MAKNKLSQAEIDKLADAYGGYLKEKKIKVKVKKQPFVGPPAPPKGNPTNPRNSQSVKAAATPTPEEIAIAKSHARFSPVVKTPKVFVPEAERGNIALRQVNHKLAQRSIAESHARFSPAVKTPNVFHAGNTHVSADTARIIKEQVKKIDAAHAETIAQSYARFSPAPKRTSKGIHTAQHGVFNAFDKRATAVPPTKVELAKAFIRKNKKAIAAGTIVAGTSAYVLPKLLGRRPKEQK